jgi:hypothetical protein
VDRTAAAGLEPRAKLHGLRARLFIFGIGAHDIKVVPAVKVFHDTDFDVFR